MNQENDTQNKAASQEELVKAIEYALPLLKHCVKFFKYQRPGREFWPNREETEGTIAQMEAALTAARGEE